MNRNSIVTFISALVLCGACARQPQPADDAAQPSSSGARDGDTVSVSAAASDTQPGGRIQAGAPSNSVADQTPVTIPNKKGSVLSVIDVLRKTGLAGRTVAVRGTCLRRSAGLAEGAPPLTRSDWELGEDDRAVWVSGPRPANCPVEAGAKAPGVIRGEVRVDTLQMLDGTRRPRVFLMSGTEGHG